MQAQTLLLLLLPPALTARPAPTATWRSPAAAFIGPRSTAGSGARLRCAARRLLLAQKERHRSPITANGEAMGADHRPRVSRRGFGLSASGLLLSALTAAVVSPTAATRPARAFDKVPVGFVKVQSKLDGYRFAVPEEWILSKTAGNDAAYENPRDFEQNLFVSVGGKTKFQNVEDIGSAQEVARDVERRILTEFMSTRIGVKRDSEIVSAALRQGKNGNYYDVVVRVKSYASRNQLAVSQEAIDAAIELEFDRTYLTTLGVANDRIYELRLQTASKAYTRSKPEFDIIQNSFEVSTVKCPSISSCKANGARIVKEIPKDNPLAM